MNLFLNLLVSAILLGCTYTLVAISNCLFFSVLDTIVYCVGEIAVFGAFTIISSYIIVFDLGLAGVLSTPVMVGLVLAIASVMCVLLCLFTYRISVKPFEGGDTLMPLLSTIALGLVIKEFLGLGFKSVTSAVAGPLTSVANPMEISGGRNPQAMPKLLSGGAISSDVIIIGVTILIVVALFVFLNKTKMGLSMLAVAQNKELALMTGVNVKRVINLTFIIGGVLAAVGGFLFGSYQSVIRFDTGTLYGSKGFAAAVVGGMKNIWGAIIGGMLLGFVEVFVSGLFNGGTRYQNVIAFVVAIIFMIFKPAGILGEKSIEKV